MDPIKNLFFYQAVKSNDIEYVKTHMKDDVDIDYLTEHSRLLSLSIATDMEILKFLVDNGADPTLGDDNLFMVLGDFRNCCLDYPANDRFNVALDWFYEYETQKRIIELYPHSIKYYVTYNFFHKKLKEEVKHLIAASDLNLL